MEPILILFDIDGTILRVKDGLSRNIFQKVFCKFFDLNEVSVDIDFDFSGLTDLDILCRLSKAYQVDFRKVLEKSEYFWKELLDEFKKTCFREHIYVFDHVTDIIYNLTRNKRIVLGLLTGNFKDCAYYKLGLVDLDKYFPFGAFGDESVLRSDLHRKAIERANLYCQSNCFSNQNTFVLGDSPSDITSAKMNQIKVIAVATGRTSSHELEKHCPDLLVANFGETSKIFEFIGI